MTSKDETGLQIIATQKAGHRLLNAVFGFFSILFGTIFLMIAVLVTPPPVGDNVYAIPWILILAFIILALSRNIILQKAFRKISHSSFLSLVYFGRIVNYIVVISGGSFFILGFLSTSSRLLAVSFGLFFMLLPVFFIFSKPLTYAGEIRLLFELLLADIDNFEKRQPYLRTISKKVENQFKMGNIKVPQNEFVYYFNMELLRGTDIQNDLKNIELWIVDKKTPCFESLKKIYPEYKLEPWKRISLSRQLIENPTARNYILFIVVILIIIATSPQSWSEILKLLSRLLGI